MCVLRKMAEQLFFKLAQVTAGDYRHLDNGKESSEQSRHFRIDCGLALRQRAVEIENDERSYRLIPDKLPTLNLQAIYFVHVKSMRKFAGVLKCGAPTRAFCFAASKVSNSLVGLSAGLIPAHRKRC